MKKAQRFPWLALNYIPMPANAPGEPSLCAWCRFADWSGFCAEAQLKCKHPIERIAEDAFDVWLGRDCWGFRPAFSLAEADGMVANWLQGKDALLEVADGR